MELDVVTIGDLRSGRLTVQLNKVDHVRTIGRVAQDLGECEDWLFQVATEMEPEDGLMAFSDFGVENPI